MQRDRAQTEKRLIEAVGQIITESGFDQIGINRIASRSGINKILIYRYFGGLDGLLQAYYRQTQASIIPDLDLNQFRNLSLQQFFDKNYEFLLNVYQQFRQDKETQEFLRASLLNSDPHSLPAVRSDREQQLSSTIDELFNLVHIEQGRAIAAIISNAITLFTIQEQQRRPILGIDLHSDEGQAQIQAALRIIYQGLYLYTKDRLAGEEPT